MRERGTGPTPPDEGIDPAATPEVEGGAAGVDTEVLRNLVSRRLFDAEGESYRIGRFVVVQRLGAGGMGTVYGAFDPELDRRVAIKVLHGSGEASHEAAVREAKAMAKLTHPNVASVYEVGLHEDRTFVAMEHVVGADLRGWVRARDRGLDDILDKYRQAALGLAAAHAVGVVHRDFKPDNAIVGDDDRVRVIDFGLARTTGGPADELLASGRAGTPAYMAPEQFRGERGDAAADQFAWCVSVWEAIVGARPFAGDDAAAVVDAVLHGRIREPTGGALPRWVEAVLRRGLAVEPKDRFADMTELLRALDRGRRRVRRRPWLAALAVGAIGAGALVVFERLDRMRRQAECDLQAASIADAWPGADDEVRIAVGDALRAADDGVTSARVDELLDTYARSWHAEAAKACAAFSVDADAPDLAARATRCLHERRVTFEALIGRLREADPARARIAIQGAHALPIVAPCSDRELLERRPSVMPDDAERVQSVMERVAESRGMRIAGDIDDGLEAARDAVEAADAIGWAPLQADAHMQLGVMLDAHGRYAECEGELLEAYMFARRGDVGESAMGAATSLGLAIGHRQSRFDEGLRWLRLAEIEYEHLGNPENTAAGRLFTAYQTVLVDKGDAAAALPWGEKALALREKVLAPGDPERAQSVANLGVVKLHLGQPAEAIALLERAVADCTASLGAHPECASFMANLGTVKMNLGDYTGAERAHMEVMRIRERVFGPRHPDVAMASMSVAGVRQIAGDREGARDLDARALEILREALGEDHVKVAMAYGNLGQDEFSLQRYEAARENYARSLAVYERVLPPDHTDIGYARLDLALADLALDRLDEAEAGFVQAKAMLEPKLGPDDPKVIHAAFGLGRLLHERGRPHDAIAPLEQAMAGWESQPPHDRAHLRFTLAQALWDGNGDRERALELAARAVQEFSEPGPQGERERALVQQWIAEHTLVDRD